MSTGDARGQDDGLNLPDNLIGIGNAGKTAVTHYLSQDWIVERAVAGQDEDNDFSAFIIDTATDEQFADERDVERINDNIEQVAEEFGEDPDLIDTGISYINPLDDAPDTLISRTGLTSEATVSRIAKQDNLSAWWLENNSDMLTDGYGEGVLRRRGLSKALYHASRASRSGSGLSLKDLPNNLAGRPNKRTTTIVVGLGGGTGSGMYLDLAKTLSDAGTKVNLVASIPGLDEKNRRTANAFAALSELEYLALNGDNPFENIVLVPFGSAKRLSNKDSFLDAFVQTIIARESTSNDFTSYLDESSAEPIPKKFAPFTVAIPQILRYDVGDIREQEKAITEYREEKRAALDAELELYEALHDYFTETWGGDIGQLLEQAQGSGSVDNDQFALSGNEANSLRTRLDYLQSWIENTDRFGSVDNEALKTWRNQLGQWIDDEQKMHSDLPQEEVKKQLVTHLPERVDRLEPVEDKYSGELAEQKLATVFRDELRAIQLRANLYRVLKIVDEDEIREALDSAVNPDADGYIGSRRLEDLVNSLNREIDSHESDLDVLDELEGELEDARDHVMDSWRDAVADEMELLVDLNDNADDIRSRIETLRNAFKDHLRTIEQANSPDNIPVGGLNFDFDRLNRKLRKIGVETVDEQRITESLEQTKRAYEAWHQINNGGIVNKLLGDEEEKKDDYVEYLAAVDDDYVDISPKPEYGDFKQDFACTPGSDALFEDIIAEVEERHRDIRRRILEEFKTAISEFEAADTVETYQAQWNGSDFDLEWPGDTGDAVSTLRQRLENLDAESADAVFDDLLADGSGFEDPGVGYVAFTDAYISPVEAKRSELEEQIADKKSRADVYAGLREVVVQHDDSFDGMGPDRPEMDDAQHANAGSDPDGPYVKKIKSDDQLSLLQYDDIADSGVWTEPTMGNEKNKIGQYFRRRFADNAIRTTELNCLANHLIETKNTDGQYADAASTRYDGHYVGNIYMSRAFREDEDPGDEIFASVKGVFEDSNLHFRAGGDGYTHESKGYGAPWDLSMVTFIGGVFLDNLQPVIHTGDGYKASYESQRDELAESVRIRHVHGVDGRDESISGPGEGGYVYRDSMLNLDDPEDLYDLIDGSESDVVEMLLDEYIGRTTFESSIDLDADT
jgi:hypothetical protein